MELRWQVVINIFIKSGRIIKNKTLYIVLLNQCNTIYRLKTHMKSDFQCLRKLYGFIRDMSLATSFF